MCPAGVSLRLSGNPQDLELDLEVHSFQTAAGNVPEGISSLNVFQTTVRASMRVLAAWKETLKPILCFCLLLLSP